MIGNSNNKGFTLVEVMVAFLIMTLGFLSILYLGVFAVKANNMSRGISKARFIAERRSEEIRSLDYRNVMLIDDGDSLDLDDLSTPDHVDTLVDNSVQYVVAWNIHEDSPVTGMKTVKIHINWVEGDKDKHFETTVFKGEVRR